MSNDADRTLFEHDASEFMLYLGTQPLLLKSAVSGMPVSTTSRTGREEEEGRLVTVSPPSWSVTACGEGRKGKGKRDRRQE